MRNLLIGLVVLLSARSTPAQSGGEHKGHHAPGGRAGFHVHKDMDEYIAKMEDPARDLWQQPEKLLDALALRPDSRVAEIGPGPGYFTRRLARRLPRGWVTAVDVEPRMLSVLHGRLEKDGARNVTTVLAPPEHAMLESDAFDLILILNTYHHIEDRPRYLAELGRALRQGGRIAIVDFHKRELPVGPPVSMKLSPLEVAAEARKAGLKPMRAPETGFLPYQYVLLFTR